jgi:Uma2 family endonuclease
MATAAHRRGVFTYDLFCAIVGEERKGDLIDGAIYLDGPESTRNNHLFGWLIAVMGIYVGRRQLGLILCSRVVCRLDDMNAPEPDILFVSSQHRKRIKRDRLEGPPDLTIEIVAPESVDRDYDKKRWQYERFKVAEYWIIDEEMRKITLLRLDACGKYRKVAPRKGIYHSQVLKGFWLDPNWLWQDPFPDEVETLQKLLGGR